MIELRQFLRYNGRDIQHAKSEAGPWRKVPKGLLEKHNLRFEPYAQGVGSKDILDMGPTSQAQPEVKIGGTTDA